MMLASENTNEKIKGVLCATAQAAFVIFVVEIAYFPIFNQNHPLSFLCIFSLSPKPDCTVSFDYTVCYYCSAA